MAETDDLPEINTEAKVQKVLRSTVQNLKDESLLCDSLSSEITSSDSDSSTAENTFTSLTPDPDLTQTDTNYVAEDDPSQNCSLDSASDCTYTGVSESSDESSPQKRRRKLPDFQSSDWYMNGCFSNYWKHYFTTMSWCQKHFNLVRNMRQKMPPVYSPYNYFMQSQTSSPQSSRGRGRTRGTRGSRGARGWTRGSRGVGNRGCGRGRGRGTEQRREVSPQSSEGLECLASCSDDSNDSEVYEMEITNEMLQFFAHSEKHRRERDAGKKTDGSDAEEKKLIDIEDVKRNQKVPTSKAPQERPGIRRTAEMIQLYGKGAAMIHGMETALQMTYDRNMDIKQPKYWPNMPLKITFN